MLLATLIWILKRAMVPAFPLPDHGTITTRPAEPAAAAGIRKPGGPPGRTTSELTDFAKQALVQSLYTQRQALLETQKLAEQQLAELESRFSLLDLPLRDRIRIYEERITALEKDLAEKDDSVRELTSATLLLVRQRLEEEKERARHRFS